MKILVADDSKAMRMIVTRTLRQAGLGGHDIIEAENGREAYEIVRAQGVDLVLSDWNMPEMTGIEFIRAVRGMDGFASVPVLMVTTNAAKDDIVEALRAGVNNYVVKPFTPDTIKEKIDAVLAAK